LEKHVVRDGDTWWNLAKFYNVSLPDLKQANPHIADTYPLPLGETLTIPDRNETEAEDSTGGILSGPHFSKATAWGKMGTYVCNPGDTWELVAERFFITVSQLKAANPHLDSGSWLTAGQRLNIPSIGITLQEFMKKKEAQKKPHTPLPWYPQNIPYEPPQIVLDSYQTVWPGISYPIYRCVCPHCLRLQNPVPDETQESSSLSESDSSFWGSSSYFDSTTLKQESSSSWLSGGR
jgi:LysM repeat protein